MTAVLLFAKAPRAGRVKTRLARDIGDARALEAYRWMGRRVADQVRAGFPLTVWYDPPGAEDRMRAWLGPARYRAQPPGDLGARLAHAFACHFAEGDAPVLAIGADTPSLDAALLTRAVGALSRADVVLGPSRDGGYYLIGLAAPAQAPFDGVPWGGPQVMAVTARACTDAGLCVEVLEERRDIDTVRDLVAERDRLP